MTIENNNNKDFSDLDDPTLELEPLSEAACSALSEADDGSVRPDAVAEPEDARETRSTSADVACEIQRLRDELKFRAEMNSILRHCNDHLRDKCDELEERVSSLVKTSEMLRNQLEQSDQERLLPVAEAVTVSEEKPGTERQVTGQRKFSGAMQKAPTLSQRVPRVPGSEVQEYLVLLGANGTDTDTWILADGINTIGSGPDCNVRIQSRFVSRHHAQLIRTKGGSVLEDLDSTNGTYINARRIKKRSVRSGDMVTIGKHRLEYRKRPEHHVGSGAR